MMGALSRSNTLVLSRRKADGRRGVLAVFAALLVMAAGAALVGIAMSQTKRNAAAPEAAVVSAAPTPTLAPAEPLEARTAAAEARPPSPVERRPAAASPSDNEQGLVPRLSPTRMADKQAGKASGSRTKPAAGAASPPSTRAVVEDRLLSLGQRYLASADDGPPPFFFEDELAPGRRAAPLAVAYAGDIGDGPRTARARIERGENFVDALKRAGVRSEDRNTAAAAFGKLYNLRTLRPGQELLLTLAEPSQTIFQVVAEGHEPHAHLLSLAFRPDATTRILLDRAADGTFAAKKSATAMTTRLASVSGRIDGSLYLSAKRVGAPDKVIADLASVFAYDVDFQREIFGGDEFEAIFEARYDENGVLVEAGDIVFGRLKWRGRSKEKGYYLFASKDGGARADYFDRAGESAKRLLMKTPIDGARLSSGFGTRRHPISGYNRQHKGVDFAAPRGTPIKAAGDGVVERADRYGGYGNYVRIRHAQGYKTAYAHMSGFAKGLRTGKRVEQGDIIGYVGSTGASTGPHLHYEVLLNNAQINPQKLKIATGVALAGADLARFKAERDRIDALRHIESADPALLAQDERGNQL
jgi:murein DD-endopeptidase MepM/ murein hydrolase activator NlpD